MGEREWHHDPFYVNSVNVRYSLQYSIDSWGGNARLNHCQHNWPSQLLPCSMKDLELLIAYTLIVTLFILLSLDVIVQWHYQYKRSLQYLIWILFSILYVTVAAILLTFIERDQTGSQSTTCQALLNWLIADSLWVSLGLQVCQWNHSLLWVILLMFDQTSIMWRFCRILKRKQSTHVFNLNLMGTISQPQLFILIILTVVISLQTVTFTVPCHIIALNIHAFILTFSNSLAYLVAFIPEYHVQKYHVWPEWARKQTQGMVCTTILACLAVVASLLLLTMVLTEHCTWCSFVQVCRVSSQYHSLTWSVGDYLSVCQRRIMSRAADLKEFLQGSRCKKPT